MRSGFLINGEMWKYLVTYEKAALPNSPICFNSAFRKVITVKHTIKVTNMPTVRSQNRFTQFLLPRLVTDNHIYFFLKGFEQGFFHFVARHTGLETFSA
jgi:hypothetical protein